MTARPLRRAAALSSLIALAACATNRPSRRFEPGNAEQAHDALAAWDASLARATSLPASRLLYDARVSSGATPAVPGTLAVTYDGKAVVTASLTGPFGSRIAEYRDGTITGEDRSALIVDPQALRAVLTGAWDAPSSPAIEGFDAGQCQFGLAAEGARVRVVLELATANPVSLDVTGKGGHLVVDYTGEASPWPSRLTVREESTKRRLGLKLLAVEPAGTGETAR